MCHLGWYRKAFCDAAERSELRFCCVEGQAPQGLRRSCREVGAGCQGKLQQVRRRQVRLRGLLVSFNLIQ
jgi:hypothetical protein